MRVYDKMELFAIVGDTVSTSTLSDGTLIRLSEVETSIWADADQDSLEGIYFGMLRKAMEESPDHARQIQLAAEISRKLLCGREVKL